MYSRTYTYAYVHIYVCVCFCICLCLCLCIYAYVCICMYIYIVTPSIYQCLSFILHPQLNYTHIIIHTHNQTNINNHVNMYICDLYTHVNNKYMYVYIYVYMYRYTNTKFNA